eukprot:997287-Amphidinium_carterae.3
MLWSHVVTRTSRPSLLEMILSKTLGCPVMRRSIKVEAWNASCSSPEDAVWPSRSRLELGIR